MERSEKDAGKAEQGEAESAWTAVVSAAEAVLAEIDADRVQVRPQPFQLILRYPHLQHCWCVRLLKSNCDTLLTSRRRLRSVSSTMPIPQQRKSGKTMRTSRSRSSQHS